MEELKAVRLGLVLAMVAFVLMISLGIALAQGAVGLPSEEESLEDAQSNTYDLSWWTVDGGGITPNENSGYTLGGTAGQPDAAVWSGGDYTLAGGFWGGVAVEYRIYMPLVLRGT